MEAEVGFVHVVLIYAGLKAIICYSCYFSTKEKTPRRQLTNEPKFFKLQTVKQHTINPKALPRTQLLGQIDLDTRQWSNGVLTVAALQAVDEADDVNSWIICDGDVDPKWVESLNSVLDDNRSVT